MNIKNYISFSLLCCVVFLFSSFIFQSKRPCFVLLTDFGYDFAVGSIKGVIKSKLPNAEIIDLDHSIEKFSIISAGFVLEKSYRYFPRGTVFVCVIDPGVGTSRIPICIKTPYYSFIGPNNGLFDFVLEKEKNCVVFEINESYLKAGDNTFHGRDLFAPAAVDFYTGDLKNFTIIDEKRLVHIKSPHSIVASYIDSFGNIKTNKSIDSSIKKGTFFTITINQQTYRIPFVKTFNDVSRGDLLCYNGSNNTLEIAINQGSASKYLKLTSGDTISIEEEVLR